MSFNLDKLFRNGASNMISTPNDAYDSSECVYLTPLALVKMMRHAQSGIPLEVMGLLLGVFVDEYKVNVVDVFSMPQCATGISVESIDYVFQAKMMEMLSATGRNEKVVGWYHSHPGFGCWLSNTDVSTAQMYEKQEPRAVSIVIDPVQSVKGKVVIEAFRSVGPANNAAIFAGLEIRQTTSNECIRHGRSLNSSILSQSTKSYYALNLVCNHSPVDEMILFSIQKKSWAIYKELNKDEEHAKDNEKYKNNLIDVCKLFKDQLKFELSHSFKEVDLYRVGKIDSKLRLENVTDKNLSKNVKQSLISMINLLTFQ